jgi:hypothetical protein
MRHIKEAYIIFMLLCSSVVGAEPNIELNPPNSIIIISRSYGEVIDKNIVKGDLVEKGDIILSINKNDTTQNITSPIKGVIYRYSKEFDIGTTIKPGDFLVEVLGDSLEGQLKLEVDLLQENKTYCCLNIEEERKNIYIYKLEVKEEHFIYSFYIDNIPTDFIKEDFSTSQIDFEFIKELK